MDSRKPLDKGPPEGESTAGMNLDNELLLQLSALARSLETETDSSETLVKIVEAAVALVPGADAGSVTKVTGRKTVHSEAPSSDLPRRVDAIQEEVGEGPCSDALYDRNTVKVSDMEHEERWPKFAERAFAAGAQSMLSFQLYVTGDNLGALNLYSTTKDAFDADSQHVGALFAAHSAVAFAGVQKQANLRQAIHNRDGIGMAKGILMERHGLTPDKAFAVLVSYSQRNNRKLIDVAEELVFKGQLSD